MSLLHLGVLIFPSVSPLHLSVPSFTSVSLLHISVLSFLRVPPSPQCPLLHLNVTTFTSVSPLHLSVPSFTSVSPLYLSAAIFSSVSPFSPQCPSFPSMSPPFPSIPPSSPQCPLLSLSVLSFSSVSSKARFEKRKKGVENGKLGSVKWKTGNCKMKNRDNDPTTSPKSEHPEAGAQNQPIYTKYTIFFFFLRLPSNFSKEKEVGAPPGGEEWGGS